jgi:putative membrane protein
MGTILVIVLIVLAIILIVKLSRGQIGGGGNSRGSDSALEIARRRYAQGDISRDEFERIKQDLGS